MKRLLLLLVFISPSFLSKAQEWAPLGATWHYSYSDFSWGYETGYYEIKSVADTTINNINCKKLSITRYSASGYPISYLDTTYIGDQFTYMDSNRIVYIYEPYLIQDFTILYNFNAQKNDTWLINTGFEGMFLCDTTTSNIQVDSINTITINGNNLNYQIVTSLGPNIGYLNTDSLNTGSEIIEHIGSLRSLFPICFGIADGETIEGLRCYYDTLIGLYETGIAPSCNYITTGLHDLSVEKNIKVYPNPSTLNLTVEIDGFSGGGYTLEVYTGLGQRLRSGKMNEKYTSINTEDLANGSYFILLRKKNGEVAFRKLFEVQH